MNEREIGWVTGIVEGEGCIISRKDRDDKRRPHVVVGQKGREILDRLHSLLGGRGSIGGPYRNGTGSYYRYHLYGVEALALLMVIGSDLSTKRKDQIGKMLVETE
jgi:DNA-binding MarR family transcriptional regulator